MEPFYQLVTCDSADGFFRAGQRASIRGTLAVQERPEGALRDQVGIVRDASEVDQPLFSHTLELVFGEARVRHHVREDIHGPAAMLSQRRRRGRHLLVSRRAAQMRADELHLFGDFLARHRRRAFRQHCRRQVREPRSVRRVAGRSGVHDEAHRNCGQAGVLHVENVKAVVQFLPSRNGRAEGPRRCAAWHRRPVYTRAGSRLDRILGQDGHADPVRAKRLAGHARHVLGGHGAVPLDVGIDEVRIAPERMEQVQLVGPAPEASDLLQPTHVVDLEPVERRSHLSLRWQFAANTL